MIRSTAAFLALCIFLWVLPLGNFIKVSQEKEACGGGRAMHMCTMGMNKALPSTEGTSKILFNDPSGLDKEPRSASSGAANDILLNLQSIVSSEDGSNFLKTHSLTDYSCLLSKVSPPPKFQPLV